MPVIKCRECGTEGHLSIRCPSRGVKAKSLEEMMEAHDAEQASKPFQCVIKLHPEESYLVCSDDIETFWQDIQKALDHSIYRDVVGIRKEGTDTVIALGNGIEPGHYTIVSRTHSWSDEQLYSVLQEAVGKLNQHRQLHPETIEGVDKKLLLLYNHFSLVHEGNQLSLDQMEALTDILEGKDWMQAVEDGALAEQVKIISGSENDGTEAVNHILVSQQLPEFAAKNGLAQDDVLQLHSMIMYGLLRDEEEGLPGEYRKVLIGVEGSKVARPNHADVPPLMKRWFEESLVQRNDESIIAFLARIHSEFQRIHPFPDGNGRIGRLVMNIFLVKQGYPLFVLPTTLSPMFNRAVEFGHREDLGLFSRLLAEALFSCLQAYEDAIGVQLLPRMQDSV